VKDSRLRSLLKAISWRCAGFLFTSGMVWIITGELTVAALAGAVDSGLKVGLYYIHERIWIRLGRA